MKKRFIRPFGALSLLVLSSVWLATLGNLPLWRELGRLGQLQMASGWLLALAGAVLALRRANSAASAGRG